MEIPLPGTEGMPPVPPVDISSEDTPAVPQDHPRRRMVSGNIQLQSSPSPSLLFLALPLRHHSGPLIRNIMSGTSCPEHLFRKNLITKKCSSGALFPKQLFPQNSASRIFPSKSSPPCPSLSSLGQAHQSQHKPETLSPETLLPCSFLKKSRNPSSRFCRSWPWASCCT